MEPIVKQFVFTNRFDYSLKLYSVDIEDHRFRISNFKPVTISPEKSLNISVSYHPEGYVK